MTVNQAVVELDLESGRRPIFEHQFAHIPSMDKPFHLFKPQRGLPHRVLKDKGIIACQNAL